jgi:hypothetical protein
LLQNAASDMKWFFPIVIGLDVLLLALPTRWMGSRGEFWCAASLALVTVLLWLCLKVSHGD